MEGSTVSTNRGKGTEGRREEDVGVDGGLDDEDSDGEEELEAEDIDKLITVSIVWLVRAARLTRYQSHVQSSFCAIQGCKEKIM